MTDSNLIASRDQVIILHTLYSAWERHTVQASRDSRSERLAWASENVGRPVSSFAELTRDEARQLVDRLKGSMEQPVGEAARPWRRIRSRERAHAAGTAGRRDRSSSVIQMASPDDIARIDEAVRRLGWSRDQYENWLKSKRSPINSKDQALIRTVTEANRVWWALKAMLRRSGEWRPPKPHGQPRRTPQAK